MAISPSVSAISGKFKLYLKINRFKDAVLRRQNSFPPPSRAWLFRFCHASREIRTLPACIPACCLWDRSKAAPPFCRCRLTASNHCRLVLPPLVELCSLAMGSSSSRSRNPTVRARKSIQNIMSSWFHRSMECRDQLTCSQPPCQTTPPFPRRSSLRNPHQSSLRQAVIQAESGSSGRQMDATNRVGPA